MTGYTVHTGASEKFVEGWDRVFAKDGDKKPKKKKTAAKKGAKKSKKKKKS